MGVEPSEHFKERALFDMEEAYSACRVSVKGWDSYDNFVRCVRALEFTSSPGYGYMWEKPTIGEWLGFNGVEFDGFQLMKLWDRVCGLIAHRDFSEVYWRVFIKQEPHKLSKAASGRWRLIMCPPLHVQVAWQMVFSGMNSAEIDESFNIPSQQGIVLCFGGWKMYKRLWDQQGLSCGTDKTAWDWTFPPWLFELDLRFRERLAIDASEEWSSFARSLYEDAFRDTKVFLSDGRCFQQEFWGVMKSGCVSTISTNSHGQVLLHCFYCYALDLPVRPFPAVCGDDELKHPGHVLNLDVYESFGVKIKSVSDTLEFVGHEFRETGPMPMYMGKHGFKIQYTADSVLVDALDSYLRNYAHCEDLFLFYKTLAERLGLGRQMYSRRYYLYWYDSADAGQLVSSAVR